MRNEFLEKMVAETKSYVPAWLFASLQKAVGVREVTKEQPPPKTKTIKAEVASTTGPYGAPVAFVGASLEPIEKARGEQFVGNTGLYFFEKYLKPLGLKKEDVLLSALVPRVVDETTPKAEVSSWTKHQIKEVKKTDPLVVVALSQTVGRELGDLADFVLPHPASAMRRDSGEVARKIKKLKPLIDKKVKEQTAFLKQFENKPNLKASEWVKGWHKMLPISGEGRFVYQTCWQDVEKDRLSDSERLLYEESGCPYAGNFSFETEGGAWGFEVDIGKEINPADFVFNGYGRAEAYVKARHNTAWLNIPKDKPLIQTTSGGKYSKSFTKEEGTYSIGSCTQDVVEFFLDTETLKGRYLLEYVPLQVGARWLINRPENQTPFAKSTSFAVLKSEIKKRNQNYFVWNEPGKNPLCVNVAKDAIENKAPVKIVKANTVKRIVYGVVMDPYDSNGPKEDAHNDWISPAGIETTAHKFSKGKMVVGLQHKQKADARVIETGIEQYPTRKDYLAALRNEPHSIYERPYGDDVVHSGSWIIGVELGPKEWEMFEKGEINAFSPGGFGIRTPLEKREMPEVKVIKLVEKNKRA